MCIGALEKQLYVEKMSILRCFSGCTGELQPLDISVNQYYKAELRKRFTCWYAGEIEKGLNEGKRVEGIKIDFRLSVMKPVHAQWLMKV